MHPSRQLTRVLPAAPDIIWYPYQEPGPTEGSGHLHWIVQAFRNISKEGTLEDVTTVNVEAVDENMAVQRAMVICPHRKGYRVSSVTENCSLDEALVARS